MTERPSSDPAADPIRDRFGALRDLDRALAPPAERALGAAHAIARARRRRVVVLGVGALGASAALAAAVLLALIARGPERPALARIEVGLVEPTPLRALVRPLPGDVMSTPSLDPSSE